MLFKVNYLLLRPTTKLFASFFFARSYEIIDTNQATSQQPSERETRRNELDRYSISDKTREETRQSNDPSIHHFKRIFLV
jgi:hypothetical protein